jgi:hypothetical protein
MLLFAIPRGMEQHCSDLPKQICLPARGLVGGLLSEEM